MFLYFLDPFQQVTAQHLAQQQAVVQAYLVCCIVRITHILVIIQGISLCLRADEAINSWPTQHLLHMNIICY